MKYKYILIPIIAMLITYALIWVAGADLDHRGADTMSLLVLILCMGALGFISIKASED
jgi:hypothetical protein